MAVTTETIGVIVTIVLLVAALATFVVLTVATEKRNLVDQASNLLLPFSATLDPSNPSAPVPLTKKDDEGNTVQQIQCPVGTVINIVAAWHEVYDPYGMCMAAPSEVLATSCGSQNGTITCSQDTDCGDVTMVCTSGKCAQKACSSDEDCGSGHRCNNGYCAQSPLCDDLAPSFTNKYCSFTSPTYKQCRPRDVTTYVAKSCNGQTSCAVSLTPGTSKNFGSSPCQISPLDPEYSALPNIPGWGGGTPTNGSSNVAPTQSQGYYVHGIYSCVADDE